MRKGRPAIRWTCLSGCVGALIWPLSGPAFLAAELVIASPAEARHCGSPPRGFGRSWSRRYAAWCRCMGGRYNYSTTRCSGATGNHANRSRRRRTTPERNVSVAEEVLWAAWAWYRKKPATVESMATAIRHFKQVLRLEPGNSSARTGLNRASAYYWNLRGMRAYRARRYAEAAAHFRKVLSYPLAAKNRRINQINLRNAENMARRSGQSLRPGRRGRSCGVCDRALVNDIRAGLRRSGRVRSYVTQSRAKYANCIRSLPGGCRRSSIYWKNQRAVTACYKWQLDGIFAQCVDSAIR